MTCALRSKSVGRYVVILTAAGAKPVLVQCRDWRECSVAWERYRDHHGLGASDLIPQSGLIVEVIRPAEPVARVSYNGRVWNMAGMLVWDNGCGLKVPVGRCVK